MSDITLEDLAKNVLSDPKADSTAKLIAMMASHHSESLSVISDVVMRLEGSVRRLNEKTTALIEELNRSYEEGVRPNLGEILEREELHEPSSNGHI